MTDDITLKLKDILSDVQQMVLCTCVDNKPWSATVFFACDAKLNIYFFSREKRRHSEEIKQNNHVSGAIAREHTLAFDEKHRGVQFEGTCALVSTEELEDAYACYEARFPKVTRIHRKEDAPKELYKITVKRFVLFDTLNFPDDPRKEIVLS